MAFLLEVVVQLEQVFGFARSNCFQNSNLITQQLSPEIVLFFGVDDLNGNLLSTALIPSQVYFGDKS